MTDSDEVKLLPCIPTPEMIAAAWVVIDGEKEATGIAKLGTGLGVREIWRAMWEAARPPVVTDEVVERYPNQLRVSFVGGKPVKAIIEGVEFVPASMPAVVSGR